MYSLSLFSAAVQEARPCASPSAPGEAVSADWNVSDAYSGVKVRDPRDTTCKYITVNKQCRDFTNKRALQKLDEAKADVSNKNKEYIEM